MKRLIRNLLHQGFTLAEVVVGVLLVTIFVAAGMQLMVASMALQTRGKSDSEASDWIQADLEQIKNQAAQFQLTRLTSGASLGATSITVDWTNGFSNTAGGNRLRIGDDPQTYTINTPVSGNTLTIDPPLATNVSAGELVSVINYCNATDSNSGFALAFRQSLPEISTEQADILISTDEEDISTGVKVFTNQKRYAIYRGGYGSEPYPSIKNEPPFQVLELSYRVESLEDNSTVAKLDTEIIPDAAFRCP